MQNTYEANWTLAKTQAEREGLQIIEHGWEQHVIIDEVSNIVYRYPRHASGAAKLADEVAVLKDIHKQTWPVELPIMIDHNDVYTSYEYIPGIVLTSDNLAEINETQLTELGYSLGLFLAGFHKLEKSIVNRKKSRHNTTLYEYYRTRILVTPDNEHSHKARHALQILHDLTTEARDVVVHGDLHGPNVVIDPESKKLVGVIDLSEMEVGDPNQEFRKIFMTFPGSLDSAIESYQQSGGQKLSRGRIIQWAYVNEWANVCFFSHDTSNPTYQRAIEHLRDWQQL